MSAEFISVQNWPFIWLSVGWTNKARYKNIIYQKLDFENIPKITFSGDRIFQKIAMLYITYMIVSRNSTFDSKLYFRCNHPILRFIWVFFFNFCLEISKFAQKYTWINVLSFLKQNNGRFHFRIEQINYKINQLRHQRYETPIMRLS